MPAAELSYLRSSIGFKLYSAAGVGPDSLGWMPRAVGYSPVTWRISLTSWSTRKYDDPDADFHWQVLKERDMPEITSRLAEAARLNLTQTDSSNATLITVDPASPGILRYHHKVADYVRERPFYLEEDEDEPVGLVNGETIVLLTRNSTLFDDTLEITYAHRLRAEQVSSLVHKLEVIQSVYTRTYVAWDLPPHGEVAKRLRELKDVKEGVPQEMTIGEFGQLYYGGDTTGQGNLAGEQPLSVEEAIVMDEHMLLWR